MIRFGINDTITNLPGVLQHESEGDKEEHGSKLLQKIWGVILKGYLLDCLQNDKIYGLLQSRSTLAAAEAKI